MTVVIAGFGVNDKVPGPYGEVLHVSGGGSVVGIPKSLLIMGFMGASGSATPNADRVPIRSDNDARVAFGAGFHLSRMLMAALYQRSDINLFGMGLPEPTGTKATLTLTLTDDGTPWTVGGSLGIGLNGKNYVANFPASDDPTALGDTVAAAVNLDADAPFTAVNTAGVVVLSVKSKGLHGNDYIGFLDTTYLPAHASAVLTGGAAVPGGGVRFTGGAGLGNYSAALTALYPVLNDHLLVPATDATSLQAWRDQVNAQAAPIQGKLQHVLCGSAGSFVAATGLSQSTLNDARWNNLWFVNSPVHMSELVANFAAERSATEQTNPNPNYDGVILKSGKPQASTTDWPLHEILDAALNAGVTPLQSTQDGYVKVVRAVVTRCMVNGVANYDTLDIGDATVPDFILKHLKLKWSTEFAVANPMVRDNPDPDIEQDVDSGIATPDTWNDYVFTELIGFEKAKGFPNPLLTNVRKYPPQTEYDPVAERLVTAATLVVANHQHQVGMSLRQRGS